MGDEARNACRRPPPCSVRNLKSVIPKKGEVPVNGTNFSGRQPRQKPPKTTATFPWSVASSVVPGFRERPATLAQECRSGPPPGSVRNLKSVIPKKGEVPVNGTNFSGRQPRQKPPKTTATFPWSFRRLWFRGSGRGWRRPPKNADQDRPPGNAARNADQDRRPAPYATRNLYFRKKTARFP